MRFLPCKCQFSSISAFFLQRKTEQTSRCLSSCWKGCLSKLGWFCRSRSYACCRFVLRSYHRPFFFSAQCWFYFRSGRETFTASEWTQREWKHDVYPRLSRGRQTKPIQLHRRHSILKLGSRCTVMKFAPSNARRSLWFMSGQRFLPNVLHAKLGLSISCRLKRRYQAFK